MPNTPPNRRGIATLEFAISLPVLLTLMVGMTWLGFSVISQTEVNIEARQKAWKRRFEDAAKKPLVFTATPLYDKNADYIIERAEKKVAVSPMFDTLPGANGAHTNFSRQLGSSGHADERAAEHEAAHGRRRQRQDGRLPNHAGQSR